MRPKLGVTDANISAVGQKIVSTFVRKYRNGPHVQKSIESRNKEVSQQLCSNIPSSNK